MKPIPPVTSHQSRLTQLVALCWELFRQAEASPDGLTIKLTIGTEGTKARLWRILTQR